MRVRAVVVFAKDDMLNTAEHLSESSFYLSVAEPRGATAVVIGGGPCGLRCAQELSSRGTDVLVISAEAIDPYNRVKLTPLLAGDVQIGDIVLPTEFPGPGRVSVITGIRVTGIDPQLQTVRLADGSRLNYGSLVLATGSRAHVPAIPGVEKDGVFVFRDAADVSALIARSISARRVAVIGGGLLGLEAARGMQRRGAHVTVIEHENRLMPRQLDEAGGAALALAVEASGLAVAVGNGVASIEGEHRVESIRLRNGRMILCDTVIVCTGVRAETKLALDAGIAINRGIVVDEGMRTSVANIFAVGECAECEGQVVGLVGPGLEQAEAAARTIAGELGGFSAGVSVAKLKLVGTDVFSVGAIEDFDADPTYRSHVWQGESGYRRIFTLRGRLVGAVGVGEWDEASRIQAAVLGRALVMPWMVYRFGRTGQIWGEADPDPAAMPASAVVCNCTNVTCGRIRQSAAREGATTLEAIRLATGANTVCGSCGPLIEEIVNSGAAPSAVRFWKPLVIASSAAAAAALVTVLAPRVPVPDFYGDNLLETLWFDSIWKQWSGYGLLGLSAGAMVLGLRKRLGKAGWAGGYDWWRIAHLVIGVLCTLVLFAHTGFRFGSNLNTALMVAYVATLVLGAVAGLATGGEHRLREKGYGSARKPPRRLPTWLHIMAIWPLPVLIGAHIAGVYAY